jgi:hypothetical protein
VWACDLIRRRSRCSDAISGITYASLRGGGWRRIPAASTQYCHVKSSLRRAMRQRVSSFLNASRKRTGRGPQLQVHPGFLWFSRGVFNDATNVPPSSLSVNFPFAEVNGILS